MSDAPNNLSSIEEEAQAKLASVKETMANFRLLSYEESSLIYNPKGEKCRLLEIPYYQIPPQSERPFNKPLKKLANIKRYRVFLENNAVPLRRYTQQEGTSYDAYVPVNISIADFYSTASPLFITEGELKTCALVNYGYTAVGVAGVDMFRKESTGRLCEQLEKIPIGKQIYLAFDKEEPRFLGGSFTEIDPQCAFSNVQRASAALAAMLTIRGAAVKIIELPGTGKIQVDEYLQVHGSLDPLIKVAKDWKYTGYKKLQLRKLQSEFVILDGRVYDVNNWAMMTEACFKVQYAHLTSKDDNGDEKPLVNSFSKDKYTTKIRGVEYDPSTTQRALPNGYWNLWHGWKTEPVEGDISRFHKVVQRIFQEEPELLPEFFKTIAFMFQKPWIKQHRYLLIRGSAEGIGKSFLLEMPMMLINGTPHGNSIGHLKYSHARMDGCGKLLEATHNGLLIGVSYLLMNEVDDFSTKKVSNYIKALTTDEELQVNEKYIPQKMITNRLLVAITTNERRLFQIGAGSRRPLVLPCVETGSVLENDLKAMWREEKAAGFFEWYRSLETRQALMHFFMNYDLGNYDGTQEPPQSLSKLSLADDNMTDAEIYCKEELGQVKAVNPNKEYERYKVYAGDAQTRNRDFKGVLKANGFVKPACDQTNGQVHITNKVTQLLGLTAGSDRVVIWVREEFKKLPAQDLVNLIVERYHRKT